MMFSATSQLNFVSLLPTLPFINLITSQKCPDLRTDLSTELYQHAVSYNSNTKTFDLEFDWEGRTKIIYDPRFQSNINSCSGVENTDKSICKLACSDENNSPVIKGLPKGVFGRRRKANTSKHHIFKCTCSGDEQGRELCFWQIQERNFMNPMSCDPVGSGIKYGKRRLTVKTVPWKKSVRHGRRRVKEFDERHNEWWETAIKIQYKIGKNIQNRKRVNIFILGCAMKFYRIFHETKAELDP